MPLLDPGFKSLIESHKRSSTDLEVELSSRREKLYSGIEELRSEESRSQEEAGIQRALESRSLINES